MYENITIQRADEDKLFASLTDKQTEVLELLADHRTSKQVAIEIGLSESAVVQRVELVRRKFAGIPRSDIIRLYCAWREDSCNPLTDKNFQVPSGLIHGESADRKDSYVYGELRDTVTFEHPLPWQAMNEPQVVPEVLQGDSSVLKRWGYAVAVTLGIAIALLVLLNVAMSLSAIF